MKIYAIVSQNKKLHALTTSYEDANVLLISEILEDPTEITWIETIKGFKAWLIYKCVKWATKWVKSPNEIIKSASW